MQRYNIVVVADEGYVQHAAVMLCSLFNTNKGKVFHIYLLTNGISELNEHRLQRLCSEYGSYIEVIIPEEKLSSHLDIDLSSLPVGQWTTMMYYKLFIPIVLPENIERCLFLDVDMIINDDIEELYQWNLGNNVIAAAEDMPDCIEIKKRIGLSQEDWYVNSGVMVCDILKWRKVESLCPIISFVKEVKDIITNEQDVIALYFRNRITILPIRWNMVTFYFNRVPKIFSKYIPELKEAKLHPSIIHFACPIKPWFRDSQHPYRNLYKKYLLMTEWGREYSFPIFEQLSHRKRFNKIIRNFLNRVGIIKDKEYTIVS